MNETFPLTHEQAVKTLLEAPWDADEEMVLNERSLATLHHGFGTALRDQWHLHDRTYPLPRYYMKSHGIGSGEDMSSLIIMDFLARRKGETFDIVREVRSLKRYWLEQGIDPLTLVKVQDK